MIIDDLIIASEDNDLHMWCVKEGEKGEIVFISDMFDSGFRAFLCLEVITFMTNKIYFDIPYKIVLKKWGRLK